MHPEHREAVEETFHQDIHDAIEFLSAVAFQVLEGKYDEECEQQIEAVVYRKRDGSQAFKPCQGFKNYKNLAE